MRLREPFILSDCQNTAYMGSDLNGAQNGLRLGPERANPGSNRARMSSGYQHHLHSHVGYPPPIIPAKGGSLSSPSCRPGGGGPTLPAPKPDCRNISPTEAAIQIACRSTGRVRGTHPPFVFLRGGHLPSLFCWGASSAEFFLNGR